LGVVTSSRFIPSSNWAVAYGAAWLVSDWYIDGTVGNDSNSGTAIGSPLKTGAELLRRIGPYAMWPQSVTIHVLANGMTDALVVRGVMLVVGTHVDIIGTETLLATDTVSAYSAVNHATPVATQFLGTAILDWTPYTWRRVRVRDGVRVGTTCWIAKANPGGVGVATARISPPEKIDLVATNDNMATSTMAPGDAIAIESLPAIPALSLEVAGPVLSTAGSQYARRLWSIQNLSIDRLEVSSGVSVEFAKSIIFGCRLQFVNLHTPASITQGITTLNCCSMFLADPFSTALRFVGDIRSSLFGEGIATLSVSNSSNFVNCLFQGVRLNSTIGIIGYSSLQIFDVAAGTAFACQQASGSNVSGSNNPIGIGVLNNSLLKFQSTTNVLGSTTNGLLATAPQINLTLPQLLQPDDYAQKGITPAMVAGTITVTVPWYENTVQQVTAVHAAFGGTPGTLSVQQTSNTQFVVTSSSPLDTSTVRWAISPLGRNILIGTI
jgi:hypothetical protein